MTTYADEAVTCGACGHVFTAHVLCSTNRFGSPDLDTRPPEMMRSTMGAWIKRCPACGFCARKMEEFDERYREIISSSAYQAQLVDPAYPELASIFLCEAMLGEAVGKRGEAGWSCLHAAWVADDARKDDMACLCRNKALDLFLSVMAEGQTFNDEAGASEAIIVDCLRRTGRATEASQIIEKALQNPPGEVIGKVLKFQSELLQRGDISSHRIAEALQPPKRSRRFP